VKLGGLGSAGYVWAFVVEGEAGVVAVSMASSPPPPHDEPGGPAPDSYSAERTLAITALKPGAAGVRLSLSRPWERDKPPLRELYLGITVLQQVE
jgi:hypothetical protein